MMFNKNDVEKRMKDDDADEQDTFIDEDTEVIDKMTAGMDAALGAWCGVTNSKGMCETLLYLCVGILWLSLTINYSVNITPTTTSTMLWRSFTSSNTTSDTITTNLAVGSVVLSNHVKTYTLGLMGSGTAVYFITAILAGISMYSSGLTEGGGKLRAFQWSLNHFALAIISLVSYTILWPQLIYSLGERDYLALVAYAFAALLFVKFQLDIDLLLESQHALFTVMNAGRGKTAQAADWTYVNLLLVVFTLLLFPAYGLWLWIGPMNYAMLNSNRIENGVQVNQNLRMGTSMSMVWAAAGVVFVGYYVKYMMLILGSCFGSNPTFLKGAAGTRVLIDVSAHVMILAGTWIWTNNF